MATPSEPIVGLGARTDHLAAAPGVDPDAQTFSDDERAVLTAMGRSARIEEIVARAGLGEARTIAALLGLRARGVVVPVLRGILQEQEPPGAVDASSVEEVDLDADRKSEILALEGLIDTATHYDILGVDPRAGADEIRRAYHEASRRFHPDRYFKRNLGSFRGRLERLFKRASEANAALSDPERRAAYDRAHPELFAAEPPSAYASSGPPEPPGRAEERRARLARHPYLARARQIHDLVREAREVASRENYGRAVSLMSEAVQMDPASQELRTELAELRRQYEAAKSRQALALGAELEAAGALEKAAQQYRLAATSDPRSVDAASRAASALLHSGGDLREAKAMAQRAVDLLPRDAGQRVLLAKVYLKAEMKKLARRELEEAVRLDKSHQEARSLLKKLKWPF